MDGLCVHAMETHHYLKDYCVPIPTMMDTSSTSMMIQHQSWDSLSEPSPTQTQIQTTGNTPKKRKVSTYVNTIDIGDRQPIEYCSIQLEDEENPRKQSKLTQNSNVNNSSGNNNGEYHNENSQPAILRRTVFLRFGSQNGCFMCKILLKEPWGYLTELNEDALDENTEPNKKGTKFWCRWDGMVNDLSIPILEVMHPFEST